MIAALGVPGDSYVDFSVLLQGEVQPLHLKDHGLQLGPGEVLVGGVCVAPGHGELHRGLLSARGGQRVIAAALEVVGLAVVGDVVRVTVHAAGDRLGSEAALGPVLVFADLAVWTAPGGTQGLSVALALTPLGAASVEEHRSFLDWIG